MFIKKINKNPLRPNTIAINILYFESLKQRLKNNLCIIDYFYYYIHR